MRSARKAREPLSLPPSYTLRTIGIIDSPRGSTAAERSGQGAVHERAADAQKAFVGDLARRLHQLAVGAGDVAADVVFAEVEDGPALSLYKRALARFGSYGSACSESSGCDSSDYDLAQHRPLPPTPRTRPSPTARPMPEPFASALPRSAEPGRGSDAPAAAAACSK